MTYVLDPSVKDLVNYIGGWATNASLTQGYDGTSSAYHQLIEDLEGQLDTILSENDMDLNDLFNDIAIR